MLGDFELGNYSLEIFNLRKRLLPLLIIVAVSCMVAAITADKQLQIFYTIICFVSVLVVNYFFGAEQSAKMLSHDKAMFKHVIGRIRHFNEIWRTYNKRVSLAVAGLSGIFDWCGGTGIAMHLCSTIVHDAHCARRITLRELVAAIDRTLLQAAARLVMVRAQPITRASITAKDGSAARVDAHYRPVSIGKPFSAVLFSSLSVLCIVIAGALSAPCTKYVFGFRSEKKSAGRQFHAASTTSFVFHALPSLDSKSNYTSFAAGGQLTC